MIGVLTILIKTITMLKNILKLEGAKKLTAKEKKSINGGRPPLCCLSWNPIARVCNDWDLNCLGQ
jgi:hypothetical protein